VVKDRVLFLFAIIGPFLNMHRVQGIERRILFVLSLGAYHNWVNALMVGMSRCRTLEGIAVVDGNAWVREVLHLSGTDAPTFAQVAGRNVLCGRVKAFYKDHCMRMWTPPMGDVVQLSEPVESFLDDVRAVRVAHAMRDKLSARSVAGVPQHSALENARARSAAAAQERGASGATWGRAA
jgi:hypothetical protein